MKRLKTFLIVLLGMLAIVSFSSFAACNDKPSNPSEPEEKTVLSSIAVTTAPDKTEYVVGESFDSTGMVVTATYSNQTNKTVTGYTYEPTGSLTESDNVITITYSEGGVTKSATFNIAIGSPSNQSEKEEALAELRAAFNKLDREDYSTKRYEKIITTLNGAIKAINEATTNVGVQNIKNEAISAFEAAPTVEDALKDSIIDVFSGDYEFDKDEEGHLLIQYNGYPGRWKYVANRSLNIDATKQNVFYFTLRNNFDQTIKVNLQLTDGGDYKVESTTLTIAGLQTKQIVLEFDKDVTHLFFFADSCEEHNRCGEIAILDAHFDYVGEPHEEEPTQQELYEKKTITIGKGLSSESPVSYVLTESDHAAFIERIDVIGAVHYNGNPNNKQYYGLRISAGSNTISVSDGGVHAVSATDGNDITFSMPIDVGSKLRTGGEVTVSISYAAEGLTFDVAAIVFHYTTWKTLVTETLSFGDEGVIWENGAAANVLTINYSNFNNAGRVVKMEVEFESVNTATYSKSQVYIRGFNFNNGLSSNNVLNTSPVMQKSDGTTPVSASGTMTIYPSDDVDLSTEGALSFECWWTSGSYIKVKSITMYTESLDPAVEVKDLEAHGFDGAIYLKWNNGGFATEYSVYQDGVYLGKTTKMFYTVSGLDNDLEYTFTVYASNSIGTAKGVSITASPKVGENYDPFIDSIDGSSALETLVGLDGLQELYGASIYNEGNVKRLQTAINKMQNGESQTICYLGGSITVGENATQTDTNKHKKGYAYYSYQWLKDNYDKENNSVFVNAAISGTGSEVGIVRAQKDVYDHNPNIIFIEYAANNSGSVKVYKDTFESLVRNCLALETSPAVIIVISCTDYTHNGACKYMYEIGKHYDLPIFSLDEGMFEICDGTLKTTNPIFDAFISDGTHPNDEGHVLYAKALANFLRHEINDVEGDEYTPNGTPLYSDSYDNLVAIDSTMNNSVITSLGSFAAADTSTNCTSLQSDVTAFRQGWKKTSTTENEAMVIEVNCKNFIIIYCNSNPGANGKDYVFGTVNVKITNLDNQSENTVTFDIGPSGWDNPKAVPLFDNASAANYKIEISFTQATGTGAIFAMGYTA